ncbi:lipase 3-like isoform X2 [Harmonia axyridis]|uniref:lipase 3-like isoform X2 n=1 Tax=Harmonia axyridis TaxID=115357 RepID=UPI001E279B2A|nr:lipase 3-like isoform X2 [Harmonia axyridis]
MTEMVTSVYWEEIGMIDMPAAIDLILANNKHDKVALLGHSEGSFEIFAGLSDVPSYNEKVAISFHFGGAAYHSTCEPKLLKIGCRMNGAIHKFLQRIGIMQLVPVADLRDMIVTLCRLNTFSDSCRDIAFEALVVTGDLFDDFKDISYVFSKWLCGGGVQEFIHFFQTGQSGTFSRFDYGPSENMKIYNTTIPPRFHLERITSPTAIFCGELDLYCKGKDIEKVKSEIPNIVFSKAIQNFGHVDFLLDKQLKRHIYDDMLRLLNEYFK